MSNLDSNFEKALDVCISLEMSDGDAPGALDYVRALRQEGLLAPAPQVIRTAEELEALDPDTVLVRDVGLVNSAAGIVYQIKFQTFGRSSIFPSVVVATGESVRAAREALEEQDNG